MKIDRQVLKGRKSLLGTFATQLLMGALLLGTLSLPVKAQKMGKKMDQTKMQMMVKMMQKMAPAKGYLKAHKDVQNPLGLLGGPIHISLRQDKGGVYVGLPDFRKLDPRVFGSVKFPRAYEGTPGMTGVPVPLRKSKNGQFTELSRRTPFGDKFIVMGKGVLKLKAVDATATDAAVTKDNVKMDATWQDKDGNTYEVRCCKMLAAHGLEFPTFGGVVTNTILHGFTGIGTPLMPSEYTYFAFWGMGEVLKNGKVLDKPRLVHGMLTEYVRKEGYKLAFDDEVGPTRRQFHLMVAPFKPNMKEGSFDHVPVNTGFTLKNGMKLPFWHVMFENLQINASRGE